MIFKRFLKAKPEEDLAWTLYKGIVEQARQPALFSNLGIPDDVDGRFESIVLHLVLVLRRLKKDFPEGEALAASLQEVFYTDMDRSLREMGAGDLGVGKRVQRMAEGFMGRLNAYGDALDSLAQGGEVDLKAALQRNVYGTLPADSVDPEGLLRYAISLADALDRQDGVELRRGMLEFLSP
ncbi:ubiquinol-cytochrome C chaperone [Pelagibius litoralis]|uniref:Ubiquinol-cytochrome C chaperone n=1 Tax=Pelagibius litoralis TaxID=374515 RepID=A0A967C9N4_9PROT|nr:ubiquinol-cytochrome C chaperone family protein [Pelagibius litoralis]NIA67048.1 ubiquinol-cytochrome C chaperone [Pelagibius litoralis]